MKDTLMEGLGALVGTFGFALLFGLKYKKLLAATAGGLCVWGVYAIMNHLMPDNLFLCNFAPALFGTMYSQIMARVLKAPSTMFIFTSLIVLVPGGMLYYSMDSLIRGNTSEGLSRVLDTLKVSIALASGIVVIMASTKILYYFLQKKQRNS